MDLKNNKSYTILFTGDLFLKEGCKFSNDIIERFVGANVVVTNLEAPIIERSFESKWKANKAGPSIYNRPDIVKVLKDLNVTYCGGANNHISDYGEEGIRSSQKFLSETGIKFSGFGLNIEQARKPVLIEEPRVAIIFVGEEEFGVAGDGRYGHYSMYSEGLLKEIQEQYKLGYFVVIYAHGGGEKIPLPSKYILKRYQEFIDNGASLVVGHHPHNVQGWHQYKNGKIYYSLGNFAHDYYKNNLGFVLEVRFDKVELLDTQLVPIFYDGKQVSARPICPELKEFLEIQNKILNNVSLFKSVYQEQVFQIYKERYEVYFRNFYRNSALGHLKSGIKKALKTAGFTKKQNDELVLLHLFRNNTHREFITESLKLAYKETEDFRNTESRRLYSYLKKFLDNEQ